MKGEEELMILLISLIIALTGFLLAWLCCKIVDKIKKNKVKK